MSLTTWLLLGLGIFLIYNAYKGNNPLATFATAVGVQPRSPAKLKGTP